MQFRPKLEEKYTKGNEEINYVVYPSKSGLGDDEVLQHKLFGSTETAHITIHPDGTINFREKRTKTYLQMAVRSKLAGYFPALSQRVRNFIMRVENKI